MKQWLPEFPATVRKIEAMRRAELGRKLTKAERRLSKTWAEIYNNAWIAGFLGDQEGLRKNIKVLDDEASRGDNPERWEAVRRWMVDAWRQGNMEARKAREARGS